MEIEAITRDLSELVSEVDKDDVTIAKHEDITDKMLALLAQIPTIDKTNAEHVRNLPKLELSGVALWNLAVAKSSGGKLTANLNARFRHIACNLIFACSPSSQDIPTLKKQTMMALKTAKAWLDANNASMAGNPLAMATECLKQHKELVAAMTLQSTGGGDNEQKLHLEKETAEIDKNLFRLLCYKAEAEQSEEQYEEALKHIASAKEVLHNQLSEIAVLATLCYNFGVESYQRKSYEIAATFLKESYDIGQMKQSVSAKNQARTLRLLANTYLEWDGSQHWQKALNATDLANTAHSHPAGLFLKLRILLNGEIGEDRLKAGIEEILSQQDMSVELGINAVRQLVQCNRSDLAVGFIRSLEEKFAHSPELCKISMCHLELLIQQGNKAEAAQLAEHIITGDNTWKPMELSLQKRFHLLAWEVAAKDYEKQDFVEAVQWYNYSLSLYNASGQEDKNLAKLHRNRAACFLGMQSLEKAEEAITESAKHDATSPETCFFRFKVALLLNQEENALVAMKELSQRLKESHDPAADHKPLISLAAQLALEKQNRAVCVCALQALLGQTDCPVAQALIALRCLVRLTLTAMDDKPGTTDRQGDRNNFESLLDHLKLAYSKLSSEKEHASGPVDIVNEALWFMKVAWNLALRAENCFEEMHQFFMYCCKFLSLMPREQSSLVRQKTSLLMAAAASLQVAKNASDEAKKKEAYEMTLQNVKDCKAVCQLLESFDNIESNDTTSPVLLLLYEFEARSKLGDKGVEAVLEQAIFLPYTEPKVFATMAALALEPPARNRSISIRALKVAIKKHMTPQQPDYVQCSKCFHSLIELALQTGSSTDPTGREEAWGYYMDVVDIIEKKAKGQYPEMEILWLMTKAWNCGIHLYSGANYIESKRWCELSMGLLNHLGTMADNYKTHMSTFYGKILAKMDARTHES